VRTAVVRLNDFPVLRKGVLRPITNACPEGFQRASGKPFGVPAVTFSVPKKVDNFTSKVIAVKPATIKLANLQVRFLSAVSVSTNPTLLTRLYSLSRKRKNKTPFPTHIEKGVVRGSPLALVS
jgi:hypothetical protein